MQQDWHPEDIKAAVRKRGSSIARIARDLGMGRAAVGQALFRPRATAEAAIAAVLDVHPKIIWPSRYHPDGSRKRPQPANNYRSSPRVGKPA